MHIVAKNDLSCKGRPALSPDVPIWQITYTVFNKKLPEVEIKKMVLVKHKFGNKVAGIIMFAVHCIQTKAVQLLK